MFTDLWAILFGALVVAGLALGEGVLVAVGALALVVALVSWAWNSLSLERLTYQRHLSQNRAFIGDELEFSLSMTNRKPLPVPRVEVEDDFPEGIELVGVDLGTTTRPRTFNLAHTTSLAWYERVRWSYRIRCRQRGYYRFGPARLRSGDIFGFSERGRQDSQVQHLVVYPRTVPLRELGLPARRPLGDFKGGPRIFEDPTRPAGVRRYVEGDPLTKVDWKATARYGSLHVRVYEPTVNRSLVVMLNLDTLGRPWEGYHQPSLERAVTVAASVARDALEGGNMVGLLTNATSITADHLVHVPPARDPRQLRLILETLALVGPLTSAPMEEVLLAESRRIPAGVTLVLVTAMLSPGLSMALEELRRRARQVSLLWVGEGPLPGPIEGVEVYPVTYMVQEGPALSALRTLRQQVGVRCVGPMFHSESEVKGGDGHVPGA